MSSRSFHRRVARRLNFTGRREIGLRNSSEGVRFTPPSHTAHVLTKDLYELTKDSFVALAVVVVAAVVAIKVDLRRTNFCFECVADGCFRETCSSTAAILKNRRPSLQSIQRPPAPRTNQRKKLVGSTFFHDSIFFFIYFF